MEKYKNSCVIHYEMEDDFILVKFQDNMVYRYTYFIPGVMNVDKMKDCAKAGFCSIFVLINMQKTMLKKYQEL